MINKLCWVIVHNPAPNDSGPAVTNNTKYTWAVGRARDVGVPIQFSRAMSNVSCREAGEPQKPSSPQN